MPPKRATATAAATPTMRPALLVPSLLPPSVAEFSELLSTGTLGDCGGIVGGSGDGGGGVEGGGVERTVTVETGRVAVTVRPKTADAAVGSVA